MTRPLGTWICTMILAFLCPSLAQATPDSTESGLAVILFLCFLGLIIVGQLIPGIKLFIAMVRGIFKKHSQTVNNMHHKR